MDRDPIELSHPLTQYEKNSYDSVVRAERATIDKELWDLAPVKLVTYVRDSPHSTEEMVGRAIVIATEKARSASINNGLIAFAEYNKAIKILDSIHPSIIQSYSN
jgi:hypothetical protein